MSYSSIPETITSTTQKLTRRLAIEPLPEYPHPMTDKEQMALYSIRAVGRMIGVSSSTLRNWEERYGLIQPQRSEGGQRLYTREHLEELLFVKQQLDAGTSPADAHRLLQERLARPSTAATTQPRAQLLVLIAERDSYSAELAEFFLRTEGYRVTTALDVEDAERTAAAAQPDVAVVELLIGGGSGLELIRSLSDAGTQMIAVSNLDRRHDALAAGASAFLLKPLDPLQLVSAVKDLLGESAMFSSRETPASVR
jgi:DNA-binding transcriptional MerR regulator